METEDIKTLIAKIVNTPNSFQDNITLGDLGYKQQTLKVLEHQLNSIVVLNNNNALPIEAGAFTDLSVHTTVHKVIDITMKKLNE